MAVNVIVLIYIVLKKICSLDSSKEYLVSSFTVLRFDINKSSIWNKSFVQLMSWISIPREVLHYVQLSNINASVKSSCFCSRVTKQHCSWSKFIFINYIGNRTYFRCLQKSSKTAVYASIYISIATTIKYCCLVKDCLWLKCCFELLYFWMVRQYYKYDC